MGRARPQQRVTNLGHNPVEAAGRVWPPRRTLTARLTADQEAVVQRHRRLRLEPAEPVDGQPEGGSGG